MSTAIKPSRITPFLWFDSNADDAVDFYLSVFPNSRRHDASQRAEGKRVQTVAFELDGQPFIALNGGPAFRFNEAVSFVVRCQSQGEIDRFWDALSAGGSEGQCGWLKDRYGLSWQVVPANLGALLSSQAAIDAMLRMRKLDIAALEQAR